MHTFALKARSLKYLKVVERYRHVRYHGGGNSGTMVNDIRISTSDPMPDEAVANTHNPTLEVNSVTTRVWGSA